MKQLKFHKDIYVREALQKTVKVYAGFCSFSALRPAGEYYQVQLCAPADSEYTEEYLAQEVANYVLAESLKQQ